MDEAGVLLLILMLLALTGVWLIVEIIVAACELRHRALEEDD